MEKALLIANVVLAIAAIVSAGAAVASVRWAIRLTRKTHKIHEDTLLTSAIQIVLMDRGNTGQRIGHVRKLFPQFLEQFDQLGWTKTEYTGA